MDRIRADAECGWPMPMGKCGWKNAKKKIADNGIIIRFWIHFAKACVFSFMVLLYLNPDY